MYDRTSTTVEIHISQRVQHSFTIIIHSHRGGHYALQRSGQPAGPGGDRQTDTHRNPVHYRRTRPTRSQPTMDTDKQRRTDNITL